MCLVHQVLLFIAGFGWNKGQRRSSWIWTGWACSVHFQLTNPQGSWRVQLIEKAIHLWYVSFFVLSVRIIRNVNVRNLIRKSKFDVFSMLTREFFSSGKLFCCTWRCFEKDDLLEEDIHKLSCGSYSERECPWKVCCCIDIALPHTYHKQTSCVDWFSVSWCAVHIATKNQWSYNHHTHVCLGDLCW